MQISTSVNTILFRQKKSLTHTLKVAFQIFVSDEKHEKKILALKSLIECSFKHGPMA